MSQFLSQISNNMYIWGGLINFQFGLHSFYSRVCLQKPRPSSRLGLQLFTRNRIPVWRKGTWQDIMISGISMCFIHQIIVHEIVSDIQQGWPTDTLWVMKIKTQMRNNDMCLIMSWISYPSLIPVLTRFWEKETAILYGNIFSIYFLDV